VKLMKSILSVEKDRCKTIVFIDRFESSRIRILIVPQATLIAHVDLSSDKLNEPSKEQVQHRTIPPSLSLLQASQHQ